MNFWSRFTTPIVFLLVFLLILTPFAPVFAQVADTPAPVESAPIELDPPSDSSEIIPAPETPSLDATPAEDDSAKLDDELDPVDKEKPIDGEPEPESMSLVSDPGIAAPVISETTIKQQLPQSESTSGALVYRYPISVPPGRNGLQPDVQLIYNSQNTDLASVFGMGWSVDIPYIERINRDGTNNLYTESYYNSSLTGELISLGSGAYGSKIDNGEFLTYSLASNVWTVKDKKGTVYKFGFLILHHKA